MKILNTSKNTLLADNLVIAGTFGRRMAGLLGRKALKNGEALMIRPCNSVHTLFMRFAIDVLFVDKNNKVIKAIPNLKPFCLSSIYLKAALAIELPSGTLQTTFTQEGDTLSFI